MTTRGRASPHRQRTALMSVAFIGTAFGGNVKSLIPGDGREGVLKRACHESVRRHIERIFDTLRGRDKKLPRRKFEIFLRNIQGVAAIEPIPVEQLTFQEFFYCWLTHVGAWQAVRKLRPDEMDATKPITHYFISSSHNTYLEGNQWASKSSTEAYTAVSDTLPRHARLSNDA